MRLTITDTNLRIDLQAVEKILSLHGSLDIPLSSITSLSTEVPKNSWSDLRAPGTYFPGLIKAGTYYTNRGKEFWYATFGSEKKYLVAELNDHPYQRIVLTVDENEELSGYLLPKKSKAPSVKRPLQKKKVKKKHH